ncbi:hypothetical protein GJ744_006913 [Endocarpon pusillum]|uniref:Uncharacterized protein n=1 Tax=Endocarpon pusillum TaxID=364733 RepID=A0A8H7ANM2_9EURO|nr:hypothetical protein GJ744_006913 [Endocarpon pusillum]
MQYATCHRRLSSPAQSNFGSQNRRLSRMRFKGPKHDVFFILTSDEYRTLYTIAVVQAGKHFMLEKLMPLSLPSAKKIIEAEKAAHGLSFRCINALICTVFRGSTKTGPGWTEFSLCQPIRHLSRKFTDILPKSRTELLNDIFKECFQDTEITHTEQKYCRFLSYLGSHDLSLMRGALGGLPRLP